jgi:uncharacterized protein
MAVAPDPDLDAVSHDPVPHPVMIHRWRRLSFLHWAYEPKEVARLLPLGLEVDTFDGAAWVGLIPFHLTVRRPAWMPHLPWAASTLEANVRTYVRGPDGRRGIWFFSLDASRLVAVLEARRSYRIPYMWAQMRLRVTDEEAWYRSRRRWPGPRGVGMNVRLRLGEAARVEELGERDRFLICRWRLYSPSRTGIAVTVVEHDPWPIRRAQPLILEQNLFQAAGLAAPTELPITHYSPGVETRFGPRMHLPLSGRP